MRGLFPKLEGEKNEEALIVGGGTFGERPLERDLWRETFGERPLERHTSGLGHTFAGFFPGCIAWFLLSVLCEEVRNGPSLHSIL